MFSVADPDLEVRGGGGEGGWAAVLTHLHCWLFSPGPILSNLRVCDQPNRFQNVLLSGY